VKRELNIMWLLRDHALTCRPNYRVVTFSEEVLRECFFGGQPQRHMAVTDFGQTIETISQLARAAKQPRAATVELLDGLVKLRQMGPPASRGGAMAPKPLSHTMAMEEPGDPPGLKQSVGLHFEEWLRLCRQPPQQKAEKADVLFITRLLQQGMLRTDEISTRFFRLCTDFAIHLFVHPQPIEVSGEPAAAQAYHGVNCFSKLIVVLLKHFGESTKVALLNKVLTTVITVLSRDHKRLGLQFNQRPYFRLLCNLLFEVNTTDEAVSFQVLNAFSTTFHVLRPKLFPAFAFGWLELVSHRQFMPKLLLMKNPKGWQMLQRLLVDLFAYMAPFLSNVGMEMAPAVRTLYKGTLRMLLVLLHDFPEFLADHHFSFCDVIPTTCVQMRNLILSAFPRNMRLPDPFTPNLKVEHLPEIAQAPRVLSEYTAALQPNNFLQDIDVYLRSRQTPSFLKQLIPRLMVPGAALAGGGTAGAAGAGAGSTTTTTAATATTTAAGTASTAGTALDGADGSVAAALAAGAKLSIPVLNALVLYVGSKAIEDIKMMRSSESFLAQSPAMDILRHLAFELDSEGRYMLFNAIANQLRYPNSHTHYFSCVVLNLFQGATKECVQEQITRVMLERLIVNRPHPWGLLVTFIELMQNPRYEFWRHKFVSCAPEIQRLFESVARSCVTASRVAENGPSAGAGGAGPNSNPSNPPPGGVAQPTPAAV
jgi:CCR4-NOT transcription complex subunit 1